MREVDPFVYWSDRASSLPGFGGDNPSPDPTYCLHTAYEKVRPGRAIYLVKLVGARASRGELTLRIHAYRPDADIPPSVAAGDRVDLSARGHEDIAVAIPFHALNGVDYALYGFFSAPSDLTVDHLDVRIDEPEGGEELQIDAPQSQLAIPAAIREAGPASGLTHYGSVALASPVSQDCTWRQLETDPSISGALARWRDAVCLAALPAYGVDSPGLEGWLAGATSFVLRDTLLRYPFALFCRDETPDRDSGEFADFILWPDGPGSIKHPHARWTELYGWLERLKIGGLAAIGLRYRPYAEKASAELSRNEIRQWAQRLIGLGFSVAPFAFADDKNLVVDETGLASCCLIVRRQ